MKAKAEDTSVLLIGREVCSPAPEHLIVSLEESCLNALLGPLGGHVLLAPRHAHDAIRCIASRHRLLTGAPFTEDAAGYKTGPMAVLLGTASTAYIAYGLIDTPLLQGSGKSVCMRCLQGVPHHSLCFSPWASETELCAQRSAALPVRPSCLITCSVSRTAWLSVFVSSHLLRRLNRQAACQAAKT